MEKNIQNNPYENTFTLTFKNKIIEEMFQDSKFALYLEKKFFFHAIMFSFSMINLVISYFIPNSEQSIKLVILSWSIIVIWILLIFFQLFVKKLKKFNQNFLINLIQVLNLVFTYWNIQAFGWIIRLFFPTNPISFVIVFLKSEMVLLDEI